jgi:hypothetical protein
LTNAQSNEGSIVPRGVAAALVAALAIVAWLAPPFPFTSPYETTANRTIVPGCSEVQCFRVLVPWILGLVPVPSVLKWKAFAIVGDVAAAFAVFDLCLTFGLPRRIATTALWLTALGFGSMFAMWDPFNADPLMFYLGPAVTRWLLEERYARVAVVTCVTVLAKEFVVVAVAMLGVWAAWTRRWRAARMAFLTAAAAFLLWGALQLLLMRLFDYSYSGFGTAPATKLLSGSFLFLWFSLMPPAAALAALVHEFGAVYLLIPFGWFSAPRTLKQLSIAAIPFAAFLAYVEQPDRALWNFHFLAFPLAAIVLDDLPPAGRWTFVALYALANARAGAQLSLAPPAKFPLAASAAIAILAIVLHYKHTAVDRSRLSADPRV